MAIQSPNRERIDFPYGSPIKIKGESEYLRYLSRAVEPSTDLDAFIKPKSYPCIAIFTKYLLLDKDVIFVYVEDHFDGYELIAKKVGLVYKGDGVRAFENSEGRFILSKYGFRKQKHGTNEKKKLEGGCT